MDHHVDLTPQERDALLKAYGGFHPEDAEADRIRSTVARQLSSYRTVTLANGKYLGRVVRILIIKAVRRG